MSKLSIEDYSYEIIKAHVLDPANSPLPEDKRELLDRIISAGKILDNHPVQRQAAAILRAKYQNLSTTQSLTDVRMAIRLFNSTHTFNYDFWHTWLLNDIIQNIERCRRNKSEMAAKTIAMEHANLLKAIGPRPTDLPDPLRNEKHQFNIIIQTGNSEIKLNLKDLRNIPEATLQEMSRAIYGGSEITDIEAEEIMGT